MFKSLDDQRNAPQDNASDLDTRHRKVNLEIRDMIVSKALILAFEGVTWWKQIVSFEAGGYWASLIECCSRLKNLRRRGTESCIDGCTTNHS